MNNALDKEYEALMRTIVGRIKNNHDSLDSFNENLELVKAGVSKQINAHYRDMGEEIAKNMLELYKDDFDKMLAVLEEVKERQFNQAENQFKIENIRSTYLYAIVRIQSKQTEHGVRTGRIIPVYYEPKKESVYKGVFTSDKKKDFYFRIGASVLFILACYGIYSWADNIYMQDAKKIINSVVLVGIIISSFVLLIVLWGIKREE